MFNESCKALGVEYRDATLRLSNAILMLCRTQVKNITESQLRFHTLTWMVLRKNWRFIFNVQLLLVINSVIHTTIFGF